MANEESSMDVDNDTSQTDGMNVICKVAMNTMGFNIIGILKVLYLYLCVYGCSFEFYLIHAHS